MGLLQQQPRGWKILNNRSAALQIAQHSAPNAAVVLMLPPEEVLCQCDGRPQSLTSDVHFRSSTDSTNRRGAEGIAWQQQVGPDSQPPAPGQAAHGRDPLKVHVFDGTARELIHPS